MDEHIRIRNSARRSGTVVIIGAHVALLILTVTGTLGFTVDPLWQWLKDSASSPTIWVPIHGGLAVSLAWGLLRHKERLLRNTLSLSSGFIITWASFALMWGLNPEARVSLAGPILGFVVGLLAGVMSRSYVTPNTPSRRS